MYFSVLLNGGSEMSLRGRSSAYRCDGSSDRSLIVDPLNYISFQPVFHECNKGVVFAILPLGLIHIKIPCC